MIKIILIIILYIALAMSLFIGSYVLFQTRNTKKNYFLLVQVTIIFYLYGYLVTLTNDNIIVAYTGLWLLQLGGYFVCVFVFFFAADFYNIKLHRIFVKAPIMIFTVLILQIMWSPAFRNLVYRNPVLILNANNDNLIFNPGPLYAVIHIYPVIFLAITMSILVCQLKKWRHGYRKQVINFIVCVSIPLISEIAYVISLSMGINHLNIYYTPLSMALMSYCIYRGVILHNIFETIDIATISTIEYIREGLVLLDNENNYMSSNPFASKILPGISALKKGESVFSVEEWPKELKELESGAVEFCITNGSLRYFNASVSPVFNQNRRLMAKIVLFWEITDTVNLMKRLENAAYIDALTGLYNRKHFSELANVNIERALRLNKPIFTAMLDIDFFKQVNDTYGHAAGDLVLKTAAGIIHKTIRSYDLLGRCGGDEFVILISDLDISEAHGLMERIRENMDHTVACYKGKEIKVTCSIGLVKFLEADTMETAMIKADAALYAAKRAGRNQVKVYDADIVRPTMPVEKYDSPRRN